MMKAKFIGTHAKEKLQMKVWVPKALASRFNQTKLVWVPKK